MNTAWRGQFQPKKIKRKNRYGGANYRWVAIPEAVRRAIDEWGRECGTTGENARMFSAIGAREHKPLDKPMLPDNWLRLRLYPVANLLGIAFRSNVSGPPEELLHPWQERSTSDRDAGAPRLQTRRWPGW
jgi:hypothetical protein